MLPKFDWHGIEVGQLASCGAKLHNYMLWTDSVNKIKSNEELAELQAKYNSALKEIDEKESAITSRKAVIVTLCIALAILAAALVFGAIILLRYIALTRKQKKAIIVANEHNELKTRFISNISAQMEPTLDTLDQKQPGVKALHEFFGTHSGVVVA